jgi:hypothetical protein
MKRCRAPLLSVIHPVDSFLFETGAAGSKQAVQNLARKDGIHLIIQVLEDLFFSAR